MSAAGGMEGPHTADVPQAASVPLHAEIRGQGPGLPVVLVHGFAADSSSWMNIQTALAPHHRTIAFDLPGHGASRAHPVGNARALGDAVAASLAAMGHDRVHLVGHSLGGAVSAGYAMRRPREVASLTLVAPGGFGPEINHRLLRRMAEATGEHELQLVVEEFFGWEAKVPRMLAARIAAERRDPAALAPLRALLDTILDGNVQKSFDPARLAGLGCPVKVLWGTQDRVLPTRQAHRLPGVIATHIFERVGHMVHLEAPHETVRLIRENVAAGEALPPGPG